MTTERVRPTNTWNSPATTYYLLAAATAILLLVGLAVVLSSSSVFSIRQEGGNPWTLFLIQVAALAVGLAALAIGSRQSVTWWKRMTPIILTGAVVLLLVVILAGESTGGNRNWVRVGSVTLQPSEIAKLGLALYLGMVLATFRHELTTLRRILVPGGIASGIVLVLILAGRDLGTAVVVCLVISAAYWVAGLPVRFFALGAAALVAGGLALIADGTTRSARINVWLDPSTCDVQDNCLQTTHGTWALASGGLWGLGPGMSREKWGYLPAADNDFIFAILGEEFGLIGTLLVLVALAMIVIAVSRIVRRHRDPFAQISAAAIGAWVVGQAFINIAVVLELLPVTGVPLPLVSSGGSSLVMSLTGLGVLMAFARSEPGAPEAFRARPSVMRRSMAVLSGGRRG
ncbi:putative lipid II flippase FtsW [Demequina sp. TTPB684]|uniref:FtsW/RodA/SpoVE family cell cycle protein n=1 Tax=unclassified Demequina TaxID=2620311 RepID=UPI001CF529E0|nr:putative peptidoglycan glycosyltransferase FtsW [Demequina sp. TMPB413]MCB2411593.1 putative lipid II flippase FtsW [Demequina sp. TTPB684]UPU89566.1 putative lipid II flippase FtsW [Demequina sp. TMPB413]